MFLNFFVSYPLKFQTIVSVITMSLFICFLILLLTLFNTYILTNAAYRDTISSLDIEENYFLDEVINYNSFQYHSLIEGAKGSNKQISNFIRLSHEYPDFINQISFLKDSYVVQADTNCNHEIDKCIKHIGINGKIGEENIEKILSFSIELFQGLYKGRFSESDINPINSIQISQGEDVYYYPGLDFNEKYSAVAHSEAKKLYSTLSIKSYFDFAVNSIYNDIDKDSASAKEVIEANPTPIQYRTEKGVLPYVLPKEEDEDDGISVPPDLYSFATVTLKFTESTDPSSITNENSTAELSSFIRFDLNSKYLKQSLPIFDFDGLVVAPTTLEGDLLFDLPCYYLIKRYLIQNDIDEFEPSKYQNLSSISECILFNKAREKIENYYNSEILNKKRIQRKTKLKLLTEGTVMRKATKIFGQKIKNLSWKIVFSIIPNIQTTFNYDSPFIENYELGIYLFKDTTDSASQRDELYRKYFCFLVCVCYYFLALWIIILSTIIFLAIKIISNIFTPIFKLITAVNNFNSQDNKDAVNDLRSLTFQDDSDINDLFISCKNMLLGGFRDDECEDSLKHQKVIEYESELNSVYNSISKIKSNNLIILDEEMFMNNSSNIFSYDINDNLGARGVKRSAVKKASTKLSTVGSFENELVEEFIMGEEEMFNEIIGLCQDEEKNAANSNTELKELFDDIIKNNL